MITILLYGHLAQRFGKYHRMAVSSPAEAVRALAANFQGFEQALMKHVAGYHLFRGKENLGRDNLREPSSRDAIRIVPAIAGAKRNGVLQIIEGIVLIAAAYVLTLTPAAAAAPYLYSMGAGMILGGVAALLFSPPVPQKTPTEKDPANQPSYVFNGPVNTTAQGHPVPVGYGRLTVGSAVVSGGIFVAQVDQAGNGDIGTMRVGQTIVGVGA